MKTKTFKNWEELKPYYVEALDTYNFTEFDLVEFEFDLVVDSNIYARNINANNIYAWGIIAWDIDALDIKAYDIKAWNINVCDIDAWDIIANNIDALDIKAYDIKADNINAWNIKADNISYYAFCIAYQNIKCKSIKGRRENSFHKALDGKIEVIENEKFRNNKISKS